MIDAKPLHALKAYACCFLHSKWDQELVASLLKLQGNCSKTPYYFLNKFPNFPDILNCG